MIERTKTKKKNQLKHATFLLYTILSPILNPFLLHNVGPDNNDIPPHQPNFLLSPNKTQENKNRRIKHGIKHTTHSLTPGQS